MNEEEKEMFRQTTEQLRAVKDQSRMCSTVPAIILAENLDGWLEQLMTRIAAETE